MFMVILFKRRKNENTVFLELVVGGGILGGYIQFGTFM